MDTMQLPTAQASTIQPTATHNQASARPTIADFFRSNLATVTDNETFKQVKASLQQEVKTVKILPDTFNNEFYETVFLFVLKKLDELIAIDIPKDILAEAWSKYKDLQEYLDSEKYPPEELFKVVLMLEQTIKAEYEPSFKPVVDILGKTIELEEFSFPINLEMVVKAGEIGIQGGKIVNLSVGSCSITGDIRCKYGEGIEGLLVKKEEPLELNRVYTFKEGVPIKTLEEITQSLQFWKQKTEIKPDKESASSDT